MRIVGIVGSAARSRRTRSAVETALEGAREAGEEVTSDIIDLAESAVAIADGRPLDDYDDATGAVVSRLAAGDCYIVATPVYRGTYTGALKNLLDHVPVEALEGKAVGLVATGASAHHYLAIDAQLRPVLAWFNAFQVPGSVYLTHQDFSAESGVAPPAREELRHLGRSVVQLCRVLAQCSAGPRPLAAKAQPPRPAR